VHTAATIAASCTLHGAALASPVFFGVSKGNPIEETGIPGGRQQRYGKISGWPNEAVKEALPPSVRARYSATVRTDGIDVAARISLIEIVPGGVVTGMLAPPIRGKASGVSTLHNEPTTSFARRDTQRRRPLSAIMLDDEDAHQQGAGRNRPATASPDRRAGATSTSAHWAPANRPTELTSWKMLADRIGFFVRP